MIEDYRNLIASKAVIAKPQGLKNIPALNKMLKPHQEHSVAFALEMGSAGLFLDTGLGKSFCALEYGRVIVEHTNKPVLMLAPLAVSKQHEREAQRWGIDAIAIRGPEAIKEPRIYITNYERLHLFDASIFGAVILDESSVLKNYTGKTSNSLIKTFANYPYKLACTATPAPNDYMELGQHSAFLGAMASNEMLARWFIADQSQMGKYKIKRAGLVPFWDWVASWARCLSSPADLGFDATGYVLPEMVTHKHVIKSDLTEDAGEEKDGQSLLFRIPDVSATGFHKEKRRSCKERADKVAEIVNLDSQDPFVVWCDTDYEANELMRVIPDAIEVRGSMNPIEKEDKLVAFSEGNARVIITKPSVAGFGLNWQHCHKMAFIGLSFKYEEYYQATRRCYRFGQTKPVEVHVVGSEAEMRIDQVIKRKSNDHEKMKKAMSESMARAYIKRGTRETYQPKTVAKLPF